MPETAQMITRGCTDDDRPFVPGLNCLDCGRFVGRDGYVGIETFEMSGEVASVEGMCARCVRREAEHDAAAEQRAER